MSNSEYLQKCKTDDEYLQEIKRIYELQKEGFEADGMAVLNNRELFLLSLVEIRDMTLKHEKEMHELYKEHYERVHKQCLLLGGQSALTIVSLAFYAKNGGMDAEACKELMKRIQALEDEHNGKIRSLFS